MPKKLFKPVKLNDEQGELIGSFANLGRTKNPRRCTSTPSTSTPCTSPMKNPLPGEIVEAYVSDSPEDEKRVTPIPENSPEFDYVNQEDEASSPDNHASSYSRAPSNSPTTTLEVMASRYINTTELEYWPHNHDKSQERKSTHSPTDEFQKENAPELFFEKRLFSKLPKSTYIANDEDKRQLSKGRSLFQK